MNKKQLIKRCLIDEDAIETYPFADDKYENTPILRHKSNNKWFGVVFEQEGKLFINLKATRKGAYINSAFTKACKFNRERSTNRFI